MIGLPDTIVLYIRPVTFDKTRIPNGFRANSFRKLLELEITYV